MKHKNREILAHTFFLTVKGNIRRCCINRSFAAMSNEEDIGLFDSGLCHFSVSKQKAPMIYTSIAIRTRRDTRRYRDMLMSD